MYSITWTRSTILYTYNGSMGRALELENCVVFMYTLRVLFGVYASARKYVQYIIICIL